MTGLSVEGYIHFFHLPREESISFHTVDIYHRFSSTEEHMRLIVLDTNRSKWLSASSYVTNIVCNLLSWCHQCVVIIETITVYVSNENALLICHHSHGLMEQSHHFVEGHERFSLSKIQ